MSVGLKVISLDFIFPAFKPKVCSPCNISGHSQPEAWWSAAASFAAVLMRNLSQVS